MALTKSSGIIRGGSAATLPALNAGVFFEGNSYIDLTGASAEPTMLVMLNELIAASDTFNIVPH